MYSILLPQKNNTNSVVSFTKLNSFTMKSVNEFFHTLTLSAIMAIERIGDENFRVKFILCAALGLVTFFNYALWAERSHAKKLYKYAIQLLLALALVGYYFTLSDKLTEVDGILFFVLNVTLHLVSSYLVFIKSNRVDEFWNFNKNLFVRILTSGLYSGVLTLGLNFALVAIDNLFDVKN